MEKHYRTISKPSIISVIVFAIAFELIFVGGYVAVGHTCPSWKLCVLTFGCFLVFLSLVCSNILSVLFLYIKDLFVLIGFNIALYFIKLYKLVLQNLGYILLLFCLSIVLGLIILINKGDSMSALEIFSSFLISLTATFVGIFLIYGIAHPRLYIKDNFEVGRDDVLRIHVVNKSLFKAYNLKANLDFCRNDEKGNVYIQTIELNRDTVGFINNRFGDDPRAIAFKSRGSFSWTGAKARYDRIRFRIVATHQISNVIREVEKECKKENIIYLKH